MSRNRNKEALGTMTEEQAHKMAIAELEGKIESKKTIIDDLMYTAKNDKLEHEFEIRDLKASHVRDTKTKQLEFDKMHRSLGEINRLSEMETEKELNKLKAKVLELSGKSEWEIEKACNVVRKDLEEKCIEADLQAVTEKARADAAEKTLREYRTMIATGKSNVAEKALMEAIKVLGKAVEVSDVRITNEIAEG